jgi:D-glycero-D-manno-heptose 1,7-bisphosphate phosphatase
VKRAVFLDRDGVINRAFVRNGRPYPPSSLDELVILPGVPEALDALRSAGFRLIVVTNQPDVATGVQRREVVEALHAYLRRALPLDGIKVCYHVDRDQCACRKPKPGMLLAAATAWSVDLTHSVMVGDRWRDIAAGQSAGCKAILIGNGYDEPQLRAMQAPDAVVDSLLAASAVILAWDSPAAASEQL